MELLERIGEHARNRGAAIAVRQADVSDRQITYAQLHERIGLAGEMLRARFARGSVLLLQCGNRPEFWVAYFACLAADLSVFPIGVDTVPAEMAKIVQRARPAGAIVEDGAGGVAATVFGQRSQLLGGLSLLSADGECPTQPGAGLVLQSSGTTGHSRIVWRSAASLDRMARNMCERIGFGPEDRVLTGMPLSHSYGGEHGVLAPAFGGSTLHVCNGVQLPLIARELRESGITILPGVPFLFEIMAHCTEDIGRLSHLRHSFSAGAQLPIGVYEAFVARFGLPIGQIYGATEMGSVTFNDPSRVGFDPVSVGLPLSGVTIRIVDPEARDLEHPLPTGAEGHVLVAAPTMMSHVIGEGRASDELIGGYYPTGDLGRLDQHGALTITGRLRLLIDVGGRKVNPIEVEQIICQHPQVAECVVVPVKVSETVSRLKAVVLPRHGSPDAEDIRSFARERLSAYKVPRMVEFRSSLPRTPMGKILRHLVEVDA